MWLYGPWVWRGDDVLSLEKPDAKFRLHAWMDDEWPEILGGRPVFCCEKMVYDAVTEKALFPADIVFTIAVGLLYIRDKKLFFTEDGIRYLFICDLLVLDWPVWVRVSETEYSIKVGKDRHFLLDAAKWTCI